MSSDAVVFIPGIKGTTLVETNKASFDTIWSGIQYNFESIEDLELTRYQAGEYFDHKLDSLIRAGEIEDLAYAEFLRDLDTDKPVFIFNYDWRHSARENGKRLSDFLTYIRRKSRALDAELKSFDFITHSLGNAVLRSYLKQSGSASVNRIVFVVPPFDGSLDITSAVLVGEGFFSNVKAKFRKLVRTFPGALELLPTYAEGSRFDSGTARHSFMNYGHWQSNITEPGDALAEKFRMALKDARSTLNNELVDIGRLSESLRKRILVIVRHGFQTWQSVEVKRNKGKTPENFVDFENAGRSDDGDGRVPHVSSCKYHASVRTLLIDDAVFFRDYDHGFILKDERVQKLVNRFLFRKSGAFRAGIPGGSIKRVRGLEKKAGSNGLPYWKALV
ncbi:MAG: hypothetical protein ACE5FQ_14520 [Thiogranum sp.]